MTKAAKKKEANRLLNRIILLSAGFLLLVGGFGVSTVWYRHQISTTANRIGSMETQITAQQRKLAELGVALSRAKEAGRLKRLNEQYALGLGEPAYRQIVRVTENVEARLDQKTSGSLLTASRGGGN